MALDSSAVTPEEARSSEFREVVDACVAAARMVRARASIRIDPRAYALGRQQLFDLNMKPNMSGAGRPGRDNQDSLYPIAARNAGWTTRAC